MVNRALFWPITISLVAIGPGAVTVADHRGIPPRFEPVAQPRTSSARASSQAPRDALQRVDLAFEPANTTSSSAAAFDVHGLAAAARVTATGLRIVSRDTPADIAIDFVGAVRDRVLSGRTRAPGYANYLVGSDRRRWRTHVPTFGTVAAPDVYPGIDIEYYSRDRRLEYDFRVVPGGDPSSIRLRIGGSGPVSIDANGDLRVGRRVVQRRPVLYQGEGSRRTRVAARYVKRAARDVAIDVGRYDRSLPLVIDPVIEYDFTSEWTATPSAIAVDAAGAAFVAGATTSLMTAPGLTTWQATPSGSTCTIFLEGVPVPVICSEGFLAKLDPTGTYFEFATYFGGTSSDGISAVAVGPDGSVYVAGNTGSSDFPVQPATSGTTLSSDFVAKFTAAGDALVYSTRSIGNVAYCSQFLSCLGYRALAPAADGRLFVATRLPQPGLTGWHDIAVMVISTSGDSVEPLTTLAGSSDDEAVAIDIDAAGNLYIAGRTESTDFPVTAGALQPNLAGQPIEVSTDFGLTSAGRAYGLPASRVTSLVFDPLSPQTMYARNNWSQLFKSMDEGATWRALSGVAQGLLLDPARPSVLYAAGRPARKSVDGGDAWTSLTIDAMALFLDSSRNVLYANTWTNSNVAAGVSISADGGTAWNAASWPGGYEVAAIDTRNPARLYAYTSSPVLGQQGIARSIDGGVSFRPIIGTGHLFLGFDPVTPSIFYVQRTSNAGAYSFEVLKTVDDGATFTSILQQTGPFGQFSLAIDPASPNRLALHATNGRVLRSDDGGLSWSDAPGLTTIWGEDAVLAFSPAPGSPLFSGHRGLGDCFVTKLDPQGAVLSSTYFGGRFDEFCRASPIRNGDVLISGWTNSTDMTVVNWPQIPRPDLAFAEKHAFLASLNTDTHQVRFARVFDQSAALMGWFDVRDRIPALWCQTYYGAWPDRDQCAVKTFDLNGTELWSVPLTDRVEQNAFALGPGAVSAYYGSRRFSGFSEQLTVVKQPTLPPAASLTRNVTTSIVPGISVTWTATWLPPDAEFAFFRYDLATGWSRVRDWSADPTYTWTPTPGDTGEHSLQVWVRLRGSSVQYDDWASDTFDVGLGEVPRVMAFTADAAPPFHVNGTAITWSAVASGPALVALEYEFIRRDADGWHIVQPYGASSTFTWTPTLADVGGHDLQVWVRRHGSSAAYEDWRGLTFTVIGLPPLAVTSLTADRSSPANVGSPVTWTATASGGIVPLQYKFLVLSGSTWTVGEDWSAANTWTWMPGSAGTFSIQVWARSAGSSATYDAWTSAGPFVILGPRPLAVTSLTPDRSSPASVGAPVIWTATASGGSGPYSYRFFVFDGTSWSVGQEWSAAHTWTWTPTGGSYYVQVWVRNAGSSAAYDAWRGAGPYLVCCSGPP